MALPDRYRNREASTRDPVTDLERALRRMSDVMERGFGAWPAWTSLADDAFAPLADLEENDDAYVLEVELPGVKKQDITIESRGRRVTVSGERKEKEREGLLRRRTRTVGRFFHEVVLPGDVDEDGVEASLEEGVLTVRVPKAEGEQPRKIEIR